MSWRCLPTISEAPSDLREKSLRLAAHVLENDPDLRGGTGYARARELLESGEALKQMQKIIDAQGPSSCRTDLGTMKTDIAAPGDGTVMRHRLPSPQSAGPHGWRADRQGCRHPDPQENR